MGLITLSRNFVYWTQSWTVLAIIAGRKGFLWRALWNVVFIGTLAAFTLQSVQLVQEYLQYQKTTNIQLFYEPQASFPAVTVCNLNPFKASKVNESEALQTLLNAYSYVMQKKQQSQVGATSSSGLEIGKRRKRQADVEAVPIDCQMTGATDSTSGYEYQRYDCNNGTSILRFLVCPDTDARTYDSLWYASSDLNAFQADFAKAYYQCLEPDVCNAVQCSKYSSGMDMLTKLQDCAVNQLGLSPYPPAAGSNNVIAILAETVAGKCEFNDAGCHLGTYEKPSTTFPGNYIYKACPDATKTTYTLTISIDSCNNGTPINNTHDYNESACMYPLYIDTMVKKVSSALDASQCFTNCTAPCTYSEADNCQGALYQDLMCQIQSGNGTCTTSTSFWTTTPQETTVLSTTTYPPTTTTTDASTSTLQTTDITTTTSTETTTLEPTTTNEASTRPVVLDFDAKFEHSRRDHFNDDGHFKYYRYDHVNDNRDYEYDASEQLTFHTSNFHKRFYNDGNFHPQFVDRANNQQCRTGFICEHIVGVYRWDHNRSCNHVHGSRNVNNQWDIHYRFNTGRSQHHKLNLSATYHYHDSRTNFIEANNDNVRKNREYYQYSEIKFTDFSFYDRLNVDDLSIYGENNVSIFKNEYEHSTTVNIDNNYKHFNCRRYDYSKGYIDVRL